MDYLPTHWDVVTENGKALLHTLYGLRDRHVIIYDLDLLSLNMGIH